MLHVHKNILDFKWVLSEVKANPVNHTTEDMLWCWPHWSVCENCISSLHLASFTSVQLSMTCLCLETSLPMQRSHWHLMLRHFCPKLVSGNRNATAISMHCIVSSLKPWRALQRGYTPPKRWLRLVEITCGLHHMWLRSTQISLQGIHAMHRWSALSGSIIHQACQVTMDPRQKPSESDSTNHPNIDQLWWILHCLDVLPGVNT